MTRNSVAKIISWNVDNEAVCASAAKMSTTKGNANEIFEKSRNNPQNTDLIKKFYAPVINQLLSMQYSPLHFGMYLLLLSNF